MTRRRPAPVRIWLAIPLLACPVTAAGQASRISPTEADAARAPAAPIADTYPAAAAGDGATVRGYNLSRWAEDWRALADPARRDDPIDRLKFLPLANDGAIYLTLSGEVRLRVNHTTNPNLRESPAQRQDITRLVLGGDLHLGPHLRVFAEAAHGGLGGVNLGTPAASLRNALVRQQAFVDATADVAGVALGARYGRQEFTDGSNLLVSQRDNNTIRYTLNGVRAWARASRIRADLFDFRATELEGGGIGDDAVDQARRFSGITMGLVLPDTWLGGSRLYLDPFLWRRRNIEGAWGGRIGRAARVYYGARLWGEAGRATVDWTVNHQSGSYIDQRIDAWQVFTAQTWRLGEARTAPRLGFRADYASGGGGYGGRTLRNAYAPFGNNIYYSYQLFMTPSNLIAVAPGLTVTPFARATLTAEYQRAWRPVQDDAVYRANGQPFAGTQLARGARIADSLRVQLVWAVAPRLSLTGRYEHLMAGPALTRAGYASSDFLAGWVSFRF